MERPATRTPTRPRREATWDLVLARNSIERLKRERFPSDIAADLPALAERGYAAVPEEDLVRLAWLGIGHDKPKVGTFMVRVKVAGGRLSPHQLRGLGQLACVHGQGHGELTTRQGIQLHGVTMPDLATVLAGVESLGLTTRGGEGDTVRNVTSCPVAGLLPTEPFDVRPVVDEVATALTDDRVYADLPRKHKISISACPGQCDAPEIHDLALVGMRRDDRDGFAVRVGGGLSNTPRLARDLGVFVPVDEALEVIRAITDVWREDLRYRVSRAKARFKFLVDDLGVHEVRRRTEERLGRRLLDGTAPAAADGGDHLGVQPQARPGTVMVGFPVPMGLLPGERMIAVADLVEEVGGSLRLTRQQNLVVGDVTSTRVGRLLDGMHGLGLPEGRNRLYAGASACTGPRFCNYAVAGTKTKLAELLPALEERYGDAIAQLRIAMDGCPHACAHHWVGDIGLQGTTTTDPTTGERVEAYAVTLGGGSGSRAAIGRPILRRVATGELLPVLTRVLDAWTAAREEDPALSFQGFCEQHDDDGLRAVAAGVPASTGHADPTRQRTVRVPGTLLHTTDGADELELDAPTVRAALATIGERHPRLLAELLVAPEKLHPAVHLYVGEDDIRSLDGLDTRLRPGDELLILPALAGG